MKLGLRLVLLSTGVSRYDVLRLALFRYRTLAFFLLHRSTVLHC
jgi:hypothetical protein